MKDKSWQYAKEDSIKITADFFKRPGRIAAIFQLSWTITLYFFYKIKEKRGELI